MAFSLPPLSMAIVASLLCGSFEEKLLKLVPGPYFGRLEILHDGKWGTICDHGFEMNEIKVACRQLKLKRRNSVYYTAGNGARRIWLDDLNCQGSEASLADCKHTGWGHSDCMHEEDVGIICTDDNPVTLNPDIPVLRMMENETEAITCNVKDDIGDNIAVSYQISYNGKITRSNTYNISGTSLENGNVTCTVVTRTGGTVLGKASIAVDIQRPQSPLTEGVKSVIEGKVTDICWYITANPHPDKYTWKKSGPKSTWETSTRCPILYPVRKSDAGEYVVKLFNTMTNNVRDITRTGTGVQITTINVLYPPKVTCPAEVTIDLNATAILNCSADASPPVDTFQWSFNTSSDQKVSSRHGLDFEIVNAQLSDSGIYVCEAVSTMEEYSGVRTNGTDECRIRVIVKEQTTTRSPLKDEEALTFWTTYKFYIIGAGAAVLILTVSVTIAVIVTKQNPCKGNMDKWAACRTETADSGCNGEGMYEGECWGQSGSEYRGDQSMEQHYGNIQVNDPNARDCRGYVHLEDSRTDHYYRGVRPENPNVEGLYVNTPKEDPRNVQHYGNVTFDAELYQNVTAGETDEQTYENTKF